jgi:hypothetical protein
MTESLSIAITVLGIVLEVLAVIALTRLLNVQIPRREILLCAAAGIGIPSLAAAIVVAGLIWGIEPILTGTLLLALLPGTALGAYGIRALVLWINCRSASSR